MPDFDRLLSLTLRLLDPRHRQPQAFPRTFPKGQPQLYVAALPSDLDVYIPIPVEGQIIGTIRIGTHIEILLDVALSTKQVLKFYEDRLQASGWAARHHAGSQGNGFLHHSQPDSVFGRFDQGPLGSAVNVVAFKDNGLTDLSLYLNMEVVPTVAAPYLGEGGPRPQNSCIPGLTAPPQTTVEPQGGLFSPERADSFAQIESGLAPIVVNGHYAVQLRDSGWTPADQEARDWQIRSNWRFTYRSHPYIATMEIVREPDGRMTGHIHAEQEPTAPGAKE